MREFLLAVAAIIVIVFAASAGASDGVTVRGPVTVDSAQAAADILASRGAFQHSPQCRRAEGIGFSRHSADDAIRRCCFWGKREAIDIGVAWSPARRGWIAVVRYK